MKNCNFLSDGNFLLFKPQEYVKANLNTCIKTFSHNFVRLF